MLGGRRQLLSLPGGPGSSPLEWVRVGRGICEAALQAREVGWRRLLTPTCLLTFPPVRGFRHKEGGTVAARPGGAPGSRTW